MAVRIKKEYIKVFVICMLLALNIAIYVNGKQLSPDKCVVEFNSARAGQKIQTDNPFNISIKLTELHENFEDGKCKIFWSRTEGYRLA